MLSEKYKRTHRFTIAHLLLQDPQGAEEDVSLPTGKTAARPTARKSLEDSIDSMSNEKNTSKDAAASTSNALPASSNPAPPPGPDSDKHQAGGDEEHQAEPLEDITFEPFQLKPSSSFSPGQVSERQLARMDPRMRAKYQAYVKPPQEIQEKISASVRRARKWLSEEHKRVHALDQEAKRKWDLLHRAIEDPQKKQEGMRFAAQARDRIQRKKDLKRAFRVFLAFVLS